MYTYIDSLVLPNTPGAQWKHQNISNDIVSDILADYAKIYLILSNPMSTSNIYIDFAQLQYEYYDYKGTLTELLIALGNQPLPTIASLPDTRIRLAKYSNATLLGYRINITNYNTAVTAPVDKHDLVLYRPDYPTDVPLIHRNCLVSINGLYHSTTTDGTFTYVLNGADTSKCGKLNYLGILDFSSFGNLSKVSLTYKDITVTDGILYFTVGNELNDQSFILVLGGYLVFLEEEVFWRNGDNGFALDISKIPYIERLQESLMYLDLTSLQLPGYTVGKEYTIDPELVMMDKILINYLTIPQSYLVILNVPTLSTNKIYLDKYTTPGEFTSTDEPTMALVSKYGKSLEYWKLSGNRCWVATVQDRYYSNYILIKDPSIVKNIPGKTDLYTEGYLLGITGYSV